MDGSGKDIEIIVKEISEDKNNNGFMFYLEQNLEYNSPSSNDEENKGGISTTLIIIIIVASVVGVIIIGGLILLLMNCMNKKKNIGKEINKISFEEEREGNLLFDEKNN